MIRGYRVPPPLSIEKVARKLGYPNLNRREIKNFLQCVETFENFNDFLANGSVKDGYIKPMSSYIENGEGIIIDGYFIYFDLYKWYTMY